MALQEQRRTQLDNIVREMVANKESDANIQWVVNDFKKKYDNEVAKPKDGILKSIAKAVVKPVAQFGVQALNVGEATFDRARGDLRGAQEAIDKSRNVPFLGRVSPFVTGTESNDPTKFIKGTAAGGLELGSTVAPVGKVGFGAKALVGGATRFGTASAIGDIGTQLSEDKPFNPRQTLVAGLTGAAVPVAGRGLSKSIKTGGRVTSEILGKTTGTSADVVQEAFNNPNVMKLARKAGAEGSDALQSQALRDAKTGFKALLKTRGFNYQEDLKKIKANKSDITEIVDAGRSKARELLFDFDVNIQPGQPGKKLNNLDFENSTIVKNQEVVQKAFNKVMSWTDNTPAGVDRLKRILSQYSNEIPVTEGGGARVFVNELKDSIRSGLKQKVPGYQKMTSKYHEMSNLIEEVEKALSLGDKASKDTAIRKIMSTMRENNDLRKGFIKLLATSSGKDIPGTVAASALTKFTPHGLAGRIAGSGGALSAAFLAPSNLPLLMIAVGALSPRLVGEVVSVAGKVTRQMQKADRLTPALRNTLRLILQKAYSEQNK